MESSIFKRGVFLAAVLLICSVSGLLSSAPVAFLQTIFPQEASFAFWLVFLLVGVAQLLASLRYTHPVCRIVLLICLLIEAAYYLFVFCAVLAAVLTQSIGAVYLLAVAGAAVLLAIILFALKAVWQAKKA